MIDNDFTQCNRQMNLWHSRLGHPSSEVMKHVVPLSVNENFENYLCDTCSRAKQHRIPFPLSDTRSKNPFDLVHLDLWGPYREKSLPGAQYMLRAVDDHTRSVWIFLTSHKTLVSSILRNFFAMIKTQH